MARTARRSARRPRRRAPSAATTSVTSPIASASSALTRRPRMMMSFARPSPTSRASRCVPPEPGIIPIVASGSAICMSSAAMRKSQASASSRPTPKTYPSQLRDHGLRAALGRGDVLRELRDDPRRLRQEAGDVAAGGELATGSGEDDEPHRLVAVELGEERRELVAREHRDPVELPGHVQRDRGHAAVGVVGDPESVVLGHTLSFDSSRRTLRRIFPDALFGSAATRRYSRGRLKRASGEARQWASSSSARRVADDDGDDAAAEAVVRRADHRHLANAGVAREDVLDLDRMDVLAAGDDHVVEPAVDPEVAVGVEVAGVARVVPAVANRLRVGVGTVPVAAERLVAREVGADLAVRLELQARVDGRPTRAARASRPGRGRSRRCRPRSSRSG